MDYKDFVKGFAVAIGIILILEFATGRNTKIQKTTYKQDESVYICGKSFYLEDYDNNVNTFINGIKEDPIATVKGNGKYALSVGDNEITLIVTSESFYSLSDNGYI